MFVTRIRQKVIDITLSSSVIKREIYSWRVTTEVSLSDHRIIRFKIISDPRKPYEYRTLALHTALFEQTGLFDARLGKIYCKHLYNR
jgi:hypothetical protein